MIIYDLSCDNNHRFEGWFRSADDFESQLERHLVRCPQCDSATTRRIPSAVAIGGHHNQERQDGNAAASEVSATGATTALMPAGAQFASAYRQLIQAIVNSSEDVGASFAEEARKIHYNEAPERSIRGQASSDECEALRDEGIDILHLPIVKDEH
jgi:hypothetical protein